MENYDDELTSEQFYLSKTISQIETLLSNEQDRNADIRNKIVSSRKEMWDNTIHFADDFDRLSEIVQLLEPMGLQASNYEATANKIHIYKKMINTAYFARIDFIENDGETEKIYIGIANIMDDKNQIYVYDWRAPISSVFYRFEIGDVHYNAPMGRIDSKVLLKRQYEIKRGNLEYFFDANVNISDQFLRKMLSGNASTKMKSIVETIQRDQDTIIRDMENDLLIVQGVAGSGKTSVALHRVAYLMYQGLTSKLNASNIVIISPNTLFSQYISNVLPELGEANIESLVFEELCKNILAHDCKAIQTRNQLLESLIECEQLQKKEMMKSSMEFKSSKTFITILNRLTESYENQMIAFEDVYYDDKRIFDRQSLSNFILREGTKTPLAIRLKNLEQVIFEKVREMRKNRTSKLENLVSGQAEHALEVKEYARLLSIQESAVLLDDIHKFTEIDYLNLYKILWQDKNLFYSLAKDLSLPDNIEKILQYTEENMQLDSLMYEDAIALLYLKIQLTGCKDYKDIKQVLVDESQDYYPIHFEILKTLFYNAKYTILGDVNQTIEKQADLSIYDDIQSILHKKKSAMISMFKSFRCTNEILSFSEKFIGSDTKSESFNRNGDMPRIIHCTDVVSLDEMLLIEIEECKAQGYETIGVLCKSTKNSTELYQRLKNTLDIKLIDESSIDTVTGVFITPIYMSKGLEFDAVLIYGTDDQRYKTEDDKKLLYIACTRALHKLSLFHTGTQSKFLD